MYRYICLNPISQVGLERFNSSYVRTEQLQEADVALVRSASLHGLEFPQSLAAIARAGAGVNNIPLEECSQRGIVVFNTPGANANGVKELVFAGMLLSARDIVGGIEWVKSGSGQEEIAKTAEKIKKQFAGRELQGKKLGVIGLGAIGVLVANAAVAFGMEVYGYDPYISVDSAWHLSRSIRHIDDVDTIYRECDYITLHIPLMPETRNTIGEKQLALMKPGTVLVNLARDLLVDEMQVLKALDEGRLHRYVSDFPNPLTAGHPHVILTPHLGASTEESEDKCAVMAADQLRDYLENGNIRNSVNYPACSMGRQGSATRVVICHRNVRKMINQFTDILSDNNIVNMTNASRGDYAYTMIDLEDTIPERELAAMKALEGVLRVRVL